MCTVHHSTVNVHLYSAHWLKQTDGELAVKNIPEPEQVGFWKSLFYLILYFLQWYTHTYFFCQLDFTEIKYPTCFIWTKICEHKNMNRIGSSAVLMRILRKCFLNILSFDSFNLTTKFVFVSQWQKAAEILMKHFSDDETTKHKMWPHVCLLLLLIFCTNASSSDTEDEETVGEKIFRKIGEWWTVGLSIGMTNSAWIWQIEHFEWIGNEGSTRNFRQNRLIETKVQSHHLKELLKSW